MLPAYAMPFQGFVGGLMIGLAAALMLLGLGRIAGVSGLAARASGLSATGTPRAIAAAFVVGLPLGALILEIMGADVPARFPGMATLITGGLIVGFGTRLGSGCTSGHGVCGLARLSPRSVVATATFMATGIATVAAMNALGLGW
ncbi:YeeE/YedE family protein [Sphingobium sp. C100]|jgi:uncharacterized protein|uniref:YeeE/YedE family protein n=1 Tax=Sphingobium sp. C100 TaxID=1207055 RepID=UPI0003D5D8CB|nr:YeeE/YedE thiosulfate transporter family protein [Sphingobium sp. C100]ETI61440.1 YeeE/YedE family protein [Sphingobium sp. C100]